jgi:hypothetical protein
MSKPLTFEEAKLLVNPDPNFKVKPGSQEMKDIIKLREHSGHIYMSKVIPPPKNKITKLQELYDPLHNQRIEIPKQIPRISKHEFYRVKANRDKVEEHLKLNSK